MSKTAAPTIDKSWEAEDDLRTLTRAGELVSDKPRLGRARRLAQKQARLLKGIASGRSLGSKR